jgi:hypothetical protein
VSHYLTSDHVFNLTLFRREAGALSLKANLDLHGEIPKILCDIATSSSISLACTIQPIGAPVVKKGQEVGGNSMNIPAEPQSCKLDFVSVVLFVFLT